MASYPSISIIIPAYNVEHFLKEALDSIKLQNELPDEIILIDDGSTDTTLSIAQSYSFPCSFKVLSVENGGQGKARNIGISLASSDYIYYFDSDDLLHHSFIKEIKREILQYCYPDIILFSGESFYDKDYKQFKSTNYLRGFNDYFRNRSDFLEKSDKHNSLFCQPCCYISKKSVWVNSGLRFPDDYLEDDAVFFPLLFQCSSYRVVNSIFFFRRIRNESTMTIQPNNKHVAGAENCIYSIINLLNKENTYTEDKILRKRLVSYTLAYISLARSADIKVSLKVICLVVSKSKSALFFPKALLVSAGLNRSKLAIYKKKLLKNYSG